jgi:hypothetical protein
MIDFQIEKDFGAVGGNGKSLKLVRWGDNPAKLDLRTWRESEDGLKPGKGITLTENEAKELAGVLTSYLC